ncbi:hypothetical protein Poli38472_014516 [Pythium oligandrum]|uniref:Transmembrane protein n=1 Tax=Pythium oligandrum TaxID=41045 RepID=A0A8K1CE08_PYTOL|nr:hypothetical protein Poli38472_014516 [Pythium oligandrum]|eukprot:TMW61055.1 hypothetical protein Poli38472_014516 [Pythium oligandrum]
MFGQRTTLRSPTGGSESADSPLSAAFSATHTPSHAPTKLFQEADDGLFLHDDGALRSGGMPDLLSRDNIGLLVNYLCVGTVYGAFPKTIYPFLGYYLNMDGYQMSAAAVLVSLPWSFKMFVGILTDCFPIRGYRRRPYIVIGWAMCLLFLLVMAFLPVGDPYYIKGEIQKHREDIENRLVGNPDAPASGAKYILLMMGASLGYVIADVACDGVVVEFAQREPLSRRGHTQSMVYAARFAAQTVSTAIVGFCFNGQEYGGDFSFSLSFNWLMVIIACPAAIAIPSTWCFLPDDKAEGKSLAACATEMWEIAQQRAIWQIMAFNFFNALFYDMEAVPASIVQRDWANVEPINDTIFTVVAYLFMAVSVYITQRHFLNASWVGIILGTTVLCVLIDAVVSMLTIYDIVRSQWFYLGAPVLSYIPQGVRFIVSGYVTVEIASPGYEATTYGLITTVNSLASPFSTSISAQIDAYFDAHQDDIATDTPHVRNQVMYTYLIMYIFKLLSNLWLVLLPRQKLEAQFLRLKGGSSRTAAVVAFGVAAYALVWSVMINLLSIFKATACLKIAGGDGC